MQGSMFWLCGFTRLLLCLKPKVDTAICSWFISFPINRINASKSQVSASLKCLEDQKDAQKKIVDLSVDVNIPIR